MARRLTLAVYLTVSLFSVPAAAAQTRAADTQPPQTAVATETFARVWQRVANAHEAELQRARGPEARKRVYVKILRDFVDDQEFTRLRETTGYQQAMRGLVAELPDSATAQSTNAPLTNPGTNQLIERSGATQLIALAADFRQLFAADQSAISLNLNAIALFGGGKKRDRTAQFYYAYHEQLRRLTGTVTFGAKVPEKEITGFSGLPSADQLFDAISWDLKLRVAGDRDPLATKWYPLLLGLLGQEVNLLARIMGSPVSPEDVGPLRDAANEVLGSDLDAARDRIASSLQLSVKGSGVHLTNVEGKNKYSLAGLLDKGFGGWDLTANVSYNVADVAQPGATDPFKSKDVQLSAGVTGSILRDRIVTGRSAELSTSVQGRVFVDGTDVPIDRRNTFKVNAMLSIPLQLKAKIPVSLTWTNDPNNLKKEKYATGQIGISYDLGALKDVLNSK